jgi:hypothetical protein
MTAATITPPATRTRAAGARTHGVRARVRTAGHRALDFIGSAYAPPAGTPDDEIWRYYYIMPPC